MKRIYLTGAACFAMASIICLMAASSNTTTDEERIDAFIQAGKKLPIQERIQRAEETIQNSDDNVIVGAAARDLAFISVAPQEAEAALPILETLMASHKEGSVVHTNAVLGKARLLTRLGREDEA